MCHTQLPEGYEQIKTVNTVNDKKAAVIVNLISFVTIIAMLILGGALYGKNKLETLLLLDNKNDMWSFIVRILLIVGICALYVIMHEIMHTIFMHLFCKEAKIGFGYRFFYAFVSSSGYYDKKAYNIIAVAPLLFFGILFGALCAVVPVNWFWTFYLLQVFNFSAAAGDVYVFCIICRMPKDILVRDNGTGIEVYGK